MSASFHQQVVEIIVLTAVDQDMAVKGLGKGTKAKKNKPQRTNEKDNESKASSSHEESRLNVLEMRVAHIEKRQDSLDQKLDAGFDSVQNQLRQVLKFIKPRQASGDTPPPKAFQGA